MADLLEQMGRVYDAYTKRLFQEITEVVVSPECDTELKRLLRKRPEQVLAVLRIDNTDISYRVDKKAWGTDAFRFITKLRSVSKEMAIARMTVNKSQNKIIV